MKTFYFVDKESEERLGEIEPHLADCIVAVRKDEASPEDEPYFSLMQKVHRDGLGIECGCRPDKPGSPLLGACAAERFWAPSDTIGSGNE